MMIAAAPLSSQGSQEREETSIATTSCPQTCSGTMDSCRSRVGPKGMVSVHLNKHGGAG